MSAAPSLDIDWRVWPPGYGEELSGGAWSPAPHLELIGAAVVRAVLGPRRRLIITMPPRHGKSELVDVWTLVWFLDLFPEHRVMLATYGQEFANEWGAKVRDAITQNPDRLGVRVREDSAARSRFNTTAGGGFYAVGVGGPLTGRGADLMIVDDPHKNFEEAHSKVYRDRLWNWWLSTARTRIEPGPDGKGGAVIVIMTRWHEDDFVGRLLKDSPDGWDLINLPALAEADDELGREPETPLWPARYNQSNLQGLRAELGPYLWGAMYQQHPSAPEGSILKRQWWKRYGALHTQQDQWLGSWDMGFKETEDGSFVVGQVWSRRGADKYLVDQVRGRMDYVTTRGAVRDLARRWPQVTEWIIEDKANGSAILSDLRGEVAGMRGYTPRESKEARAHAVSGHLAAGNIWLPEGDQLPSGSSVADLIDECATFPNGMNDDQVDCLTQALIHMGVGQAVIEAKPYLDQRLSGRR